MAAHMMRGRVKDTYKATSPFSNVSDPGRPVLGTRIKGSILIQLTYGCRWTAIPSSRVRRVGRRIARPVFQSAFRPTAISVHILDPRS